jgi:two-component system sensor histidine kinase RstB
LPISPKKSALILLAILLINLISASLLDSHVYYKLENYVLKQHDANLFKIKKEMHQKFKSSSDDQWQSIVISLGGEFNTENEGEIIARNATNLSAESFKLLQLPQFQTGWVDTKNSIVFYPLNEQFVAKLGPVPYDSWLAFIVYWFSWTCAITLNLALAFLYIRHIEQQRSKLSQVIDDFPFEFNDNNETIYDDIKELKILIVKTQEVNKTRLLLQRDLLHGVAHEFRSPMARIQFALDMLDDVSETEQEELKQSMHQSLSELDKLVKELLYYAKLKNTESAINYERFHLEELCQVVVKQVKHFYPNIEFNLTYSTEVIMNADKNLIQRVLINLLRNAGRFAASQCNINLTQKKQEIVLLIDDDGIGIPPGKTLRIFEPFTRLDLSRSRDSGGCGLGLAIVSSIINKHKGSVSVVEGALGGACFKVTIPKISPASMVTSQ